MIRHVLGEVLKELQANCGSIHVAVNISLKAMCIVNVLDALNEARELHLVLRTDVVCGRHGAQELHELLAELVADRLLELCQDFHTILVLLNDYFTLQRVLLAAFISLE